MDSLIIEGCNKLENVFPRYMVGRFRSVCNLKVNDCTSMKEIFDLRGCGKPNAEYMMNLQNFHVQALPKLEHVWNGNPEGILNFKNLKKILVQECLNLKHIFPVSIAMGLEQLECLEVRNCGQLKEIVSRVETNEVTFKFPELTTARFFELPNLEGFCGGTHELCCSILNDLSLEQCHKFKLFITELKPFFSPKEVIYNLKSMQIEEHDAYPLKRYMGNYRMHKLEEFQLSGLQDTYILDFFLHRNPNLKRLLLSNCLVKQFVPQISLAEKSGVVPKLKSLKLVNLPSLEKIGFEEYKVLFRMLECLILEECPCLNAIAASSVSFTYLTNLEVKNCDKLSHLMTASTAKSLVQLTTMKVSQCKSMVTIVLEPEHQEKIDFRELKEIELVSLQELESFCGSNLCILTFPSLEKFVVLACDKMETFTSPEQVNSTPVLKQVSVRYGRGEQRSYWKGDLNFTIRHMYKNWALDKDNMSASNPLEALQSSQLKTLVLTNCQYGANAIPTNLFTGLKNLEELEVSSSTIVNVIFDKFETDKMKGYTFPLKKLILRGLPNLKHVWDKDQERIFSFQNLQQVCVTDCHKLETLFPVELAKRIERLQKLEIKKCGGFVQIVQEEKDTIEEEFSFPRLSTLNLHLLPQLSYFYPGPFTLECPDLDHLEVLFCGNFESFQSPQEAQSSTSVYRQPLFSQKEANFILESLKLDWKNTMMLCNGKFPEDMLHKLVELELDFDDVNEVSNFPIVLLEKAFNLEYLEIRRCRGLEELLPSQPQLGGHVTTSVHSTPSFSRLKKLSIKECHGLRYLFTSSIARKLVHLELMQVTLCESMQEILAKENEEITPEAIKLERLNTIILDSLSSLHCFYSGSDTLQFPSLIHVRVEKCPKMKSFSTADAESLSGIRLTLDGKPILHQDINSTAKIIQGSEFFEAVDKECFSDGREQQAALDGEVGLQNNWFSNLVEEEQATDITSDDKYCNEYFEASDNECSPSLDETILRGNVKQRKIWLRNLKRVKLKRFTRAYAISSDILPHLKKLEELEVKNSDQVQDYFEASDNECSPSLDETILRGNVKQRKIWLRNLKRVKLKRFTRAYAISSDILPHLKKLEELEVKNSDQVQDYFEASNNECSPSFDETILRGNVKQRKVWLRSLKRVKLKRFTRAYAISSDIVSRLNKLEELEVKNSDQVQEYFEALDKKCSPTFDETILRGNVKQQNIWLRNLKRLKLKRFTRAYVIPSYILPLLKKLEELEVKDSDQVEVIFDISDNEKLTTFPLKVLTLKRLSKLRKVWEMNTEGDTFSLLREVVVSSCENLQTLFSMAKNHKQLEKLEIDSCDKLLEMVDNEEGTLADATKMFVFPYLEKLYLHDLPELTYFYPETFTLNCPSLNQLAVLYCHKLKLFPSVYPSEDGEGIVNRLSLISDEKVKQSITESVIPNMKVLNLDWKHISALSLWFKLEQFMEDLEHLQEVSLSCFHPDENEKPVLQFEILQKAPNLEALDMGFLSSPEIFLAQTLKIGEDGILGQLKTLNLYEVSNLHSMESEDKSLLNTICEKLHELNVFSCHNLTTLIHSVSFSCLKRVKVYDCPDIQFLFTSSAAKTLTNLEEITVQECESVKEIVAKEREATSEIKFERLHTIILESLPSLICFYSGSDTLHLPSLINVDITECSNMKIFSQGDIVANEDLFSNQNLLANVKRMFQPQVQGIRDTQNAKI
ncbi:unnamed protein product [Sphenostylis stenocarpa]|uniref:Disease resistance protein At4g27190-like leucine-rich repeats domain-containing protein n=1 Tax=Sphenostylis stenocarpa TaxID=92480 RepID=A0AA86VMX3_9FABA|nr:unnamed protein product [Sphenostylis stenocarpa]